MVVLHSFKQLSWLFFSPFLNWPGGRVSPISFVPGGAFAASEWLSPRFERKRQRCNDGFASGNFRQILFSILFFFLTDRFGEVSTLQNLGSFLGLLNLHLIFLYIIWVWIFSFYLLFWLFSGIQDLTNTWAIIIFQAVKKVKAIKFWDISPLDHLLARLAIDGSKKICSKIIQLLLPSFFPLDQVLKLKFRVFFCTLVLFGWQASCSSLVFLNQPSSKSTLRLAGLEHMQQR